MLTFTHIFLTTGSVAGRAAGMRVHALTLALRKRKVGYSQATQEPRYADLATIL